MGCEAQIKLHNSPGLSSYPRKTVAGLTAPQNPTRRLFSPHTPLPPSSSSPIAHLPRFLVCPQPPPFPSAEQGQRKPARGSSSRRLPPARHNRREGPQPTLLLLAGSASSPPPPLLPATRTFGPQPLRETSQSAPHGTPLPSGTTAGAP
jgi:hypothetical protein